VTPSQTAPTPQPGDRLVAAIEAQTVAIERANAEGVLDPDRRPDGDHVGGHDGVRGRGEGWLTPSFR